MKVGWVTPNTDNVPFPFGGGEWPCPGHVMLELEEECTIVLSA